MKRIIQTSLFITLAFQLLSCSTTHLIAPDLEKIQTRDGQNIGGVAVYNPHGLKQLVEARRNQAFKRMRAACAPLTFDILSEENEAPNKRNPKYKASVANLTGKTVRFIEYKCIDF